MAVPSYTTDLTDISTAQSTTGWSEVLDGAWDDGGTPSADGDFPYIQDTLAISQTMTKSTICSLIYNNGSGITLPTDGAYLVWQNWSSPPVLDTLANGGMRVVVGSGTGAAYSWDTGGSDFGRNPYGGWQNSAVNTTVASDDTIGTPGATEQYVGSAMSPTAGIGKGNPHQVDAVRYGRCEARMNGGQAADYATFAGFSTQNDSTTNRWGLIQAVSGGFLWKGLMRLGYTSAVDFRDSDVLILVDDTRKVTAGFNKIDVEQATSRVDWTNITIQALGTVSKGAFEAIANADINFDGCKFIDMSTLKFDSNSTVLNTSFQRCALVTANGGTFTGCQFEEPAGVSGILCATPAGATLVSDSAFTSDGTGYGISVNGTAANITLTNVDFSGYAATDGSTGNEAVLINIATGSLNLNISGGTNPSVRTAGAVVTKVINPVTTLVHVNDHDGSNLVGARVLLEASDGLGDFPYRTIVTVTHVTTTATVSHLNHGLNNNDWVVIRYADQNEYNGSFQITVTGAGVYTYVMDSDPGENATGTIRSSGAILSGTTDLNGDISGSRSFSTATAVKGVVRKSTASPRYKSFGMTGSISTTTGLTINVRMVLDES